MTKSLTLTRGVALAGALTLSHAATALAAASSTTTSTASIKASSGENTPVNLGGSSLPSHAASSSGSSGIVRTIVGLFIVIAVIYGVAWILRQAKKGKSRATGNGLSQLASLPLGNGRSVALVRAGKYNNFAMPGAGTPPHLSTELFRLSLKLDFVVVPFRHRLCPRLGADDVGKHQAIGCVAYAEIAVLEERPQTVVLESAGLEMTDRKLEAVFHCSSFARAFRPL